MTPERLIHVTDPEYRIAVLRQVSALLAGEIPVPHSDDPRLLSHWQLSQLGIERPIGWSDPVWWAMRAGYVRGVCRAFSRAVCGEPVSDRDLRYRADYPPEEQARWRPQIVLLLREWDPKNPKQCQSRFEAARRAVLFQERC